MLLAWTEKLTVWQGSDSLSASVDQLTKATQNSLAAIVGGQVVYGYYPSEKLQSGIQLNTTDQIRRNGVAQSIPLTVAPDSVDGPIQVRIHKSKF